VTRIIGSHYPAAPPRCLRLTTSRFRRRGKRRLLDPRVSSALSRSSDGVRPARAAVIRVRRHRPASGGIQPRAPWAVRPRGDRATSEGASRRGRRGVCFGRPARAKRRLSRGWNLALTPMSSGTNRLTGSTVRRPLARSRPSVLGPPMRGDCGWGDRIGWHPHRSRRRGQMTGRAQAPPGMNVPASG
jgi:hypothetical protein